MKYLLICGGVGGAKLALGFSKAIDSNLIDIVVNTIYQSCILIKISDKIYHYSNIFIFYLRLNLNKFI